MDSRHSVQSCPYKATPHCLWRGICLVVSEIGFRAVAESYLCPADIMPDALNSLPAVSPVVDEQIEAGVPINFFVKSLQKMWYEPGSAIVPK